MTPPESSQDLFDSRFQVYYSMRAYLLSRVQLFCDPMDCSPPGSFVHGVSQARILEWVAITFSHVNYTSVKNKTKHYFASRLMLCPLGSPWLSCLTSLPLSPVYLVITSSKRRSLSPQYKTLPLQVIYCPSMGLGTEELVA